MKIQTISGKKVIQDRWYSVEEKDLIIRKICAALPIILPELETTTVVTRPRVECDVFLPEIGHHGRSLLGVPLVWFPAPAASHESGLILAGTRDDGNFSIVTLSCALWTLTPSLRRYHVVLCASPDGCQLGLRASANGVDLSRNFPAANWKEGETVYRWNSAAEERDVVLPTGDKPSPEPETQALCQLIHRIQPAWVVSFHDPLAYTGDPRRSELGEWLTQAFELPLVASVDYETPGSFGSWCADFNLHCIAAEFPPISSNEVSEKCLFVMVNLLRWHPKDAIRPP